MDRTNEADCPCPFASHSERFERTSEAFRTLVAVEGQYRRKAKQAAYPGALQADRN